MAGEIYIYISSTCGVVFYLIEFYTAKETYKNLFFEERKQDNKRLNYYSIRLRLCNILYDYSMLSYNYVNNLRSPVIVFSVYFCIDFVILIIRSYFAYVLQYKIKDRVDEMQEISKKPHASVGMRDLVCDANKSTSFEETVKNPIHEILDQTI